MGWNFLRGDDKPGGGVFGFIDSARKKGTTVAKKTTGAAAGVGREFVKGGLRVGMSLAEYADDQARKKVEQEFVKKNKGKIPDEQINKVLEGTKKKDEANDLTLTPGKGRLSRTVLGNEPLTTYQKGAEGSKKEFEEGTSLINKIGVSKDITNPLAAPLSLIGASLAGILDATPGGGKAKGIFESLAKESTADGVRKLLGDKNISEETVEAIARTKDKNVVRNILKGKSDIPDEVPQMIPPPPKPVKAPKTPELKEHPEVTQINDTIKDQEALIKHAPNDKNAATHRKVIRDLIRERGEINAKFNPDGTPKGLAEATTPQPLKITNNSGGPLVGEDVYGAAQQSHMAKRPSVFADQGGGYDGGRGAAGRAADDQLIDATVPKAPVSKPPVEPKAPTPGQKIVDSQANTNTDDPFEELGSLISGTKASKGQAGKKGIATASKEQADLLSKERGERFGKVAEVQDDSFDGYIKQKSKLSGQYTKLDNPLDIPEEDAQRLFQATSKKVREAPDKFYEDMGYHAEGARLNTRKAIAKALGLEPGLPTKSELKLIRAFSPKLADDISDITPFHHKIMDAAGVLFGNVRSLKSSLDFSMGGRQGIFVAARHPVVWAKANVESIKYAKSGQYYKDQMKALHNSEWGQLADKYNKNLLTGGRGSEEAFAATDIAASKVAKDKLKVGNLVVGSERAYTGGLTKMRHDLLEKTLRAYGDTAEEAEAALGPKGMEGIMETIGTLTGRGGKKGGFTDKHATTLQAALFSPKLWASRLQPLNPAYWKRIGPAGRKEAIQNYGAFAAVAGVVLSAAVAMGADVETDPRSSDFLKIKVGDTRYDILGGFQQNLVFLARELSGETKSSTTGKVTKLGEEFGGPTRLSVGFDVVRNKANPVLAAAANIAEGKDKAGNKINPVTEIGQLFVPIGVQNAFNNAQRENGAKSVLKGLPEVVGISSQEYGVQDVNLPDSQKEYLARLKKEGASDERIEAATRLLQQVKTAPSRDNVSNGIKEALRQGDTAKAKELAKDYNKRYSESFNDWREKYGKYKDEDLMKVYNSKLISAESLRRWADSVAKEGSGRL